MATALMLSAAGCGQGEAAAHKPADPQGTAGTTAGGAAGSGGAGAAGGAAGTGGSADDCGPIGDSFYAVTEGGLLLRVSPPALGLLEVGSPVCPGASGPVYSMAVDRHGVAWLLYQSGALYKVSTGDLSCHKAFRDGSQGWSVFGMGFVSDEAGGASETLFIADATHSTFHLEGGEDGLGFLDRNLNFGQIGPFDAGLKGRLVELTGRGDGKLFGFFVQEPSVAEIAPKTGHILSIEAIDVPAPTAWAFAHWGGRFYLFDAPGTQNSRLYRLTPGKPLELQILDTGHRIVGAGVSTCAPFVSVVGE
jgi:hypothetical protein